MTLFIASIAKTWINDNLLFCQFICQGRDIAPRGGDNRRNFRRDRGSDDECYSRPSAPATLFDFVTTKMTRSSTSLGKLDEFHIIL